MNPAEEACAAPSIREALQQAEAASLAADLRAKTRSLQHAKAQQHAATAEEVVTALGGKAAEYFGLKQEAAPRSELMPVLYAGITALRQATVRAENAGLQSEPHMDAVLRSARHVRAGLEDERAEFLSTMRRLL